VGDGIDVADPGDELAFEPDNTNQTQPGGTGRSAQTTPDP